MSRECKTPLTVVAVAAWLLTGMSAGVAQQKPAEKPVVKPQHDVEHIHHEQMEHASHDGFMGRGMAHAIAPGVHLGQQVDAATHTIVLREGPMTLPANTDHMKMPQPADLMWTIPIDGWLLAYHPRLVDANGNAVPGQVLHHTAFWNVNRSDFLCPNKEEHIFGAGSEMNDWPPIPGYGYRVQKGDHIRIETMMYNPTPTSYDQVYLEVKIPFQETGGAGAPPVKSVYPAWMDVKSCGSSGYDVPVGKSSKTGVVPVKYDGVLLGVGGHLHDYGRQLVLEDATKKETVATLNAKVDEQGRLLDIPIETFFAKGGVRFNRGDELKITAAYDNPTGRYLRQGAMGIVVGYFLPDDDGEMAVLRREKKTVAGGTGHSPN